MLDWTEEKLILSKMYSELLNMGGRFRNMTSYKLENSVNIKLIWLRMYILKCNSVFYFWQLLLTAVKQC